MRPIVRAADAPLETTLRILRATTATPEQQQRQGQRQRSPSSPEPLVVWVRVPGWAHGAHLVARADKKHTADDARRRTLWNGGARMPDTIAATGVTCPWLVSHFTLR